MLKYVLHSYAMNLQLAGNLVKELTAEQMCRQPAGVINHPAWTLGHLAISADFLGTMLGLESGAPAGWGEKFRPGVAPMPDPAAYPSKEDLLDALGRLHARNAEAVGKVDAAALEQLNPNERMRSYFPTLGDLAVFMMTSHEMDHLGQVAAWRRALGIGPAS